MTENTVIKAPPVSSIEKYGVLWHRDYCQYLTSVRDIYSCYTSNKILDKCKDCPYTKQLESELNFYDSKEPENML